MKKVQGFPIPLGVTIEKEFVNFSVEVPSGKTCELLLYKAGTKEPVEKFVLAQEDGIGEIRFMGLNGERIEDYEYNYYIDGKVVVDPYVKALAGTQHWKQPRDISMHEVRGRFVSAFYDWQGDKPLHLPYDEIVAYSLHVRGFTKHSSSKVKQKGTFGGIVEKLSYLKELGINQIQCMPPYDFNEVGKNAVNYWGYGPAFYFAPKAAYSASEDTARECKDMIRLLHAEGIEVIFHFPFTAQTPPQMIERCLEYYVMEYHVDGFILNPMNAPMDALKRNPLLKSTKLIRMEDGFQNVMRRFLKGDEGMIHDVMWALRHNTSEDQLPNYITSHTGFTLKDLVSYDAKHNEENGEKNQDGPDYNYSWNCGAEGPSRKKSIVTLRKNQVRNAFFLLLMAQGTPCLLAGDEFGNTQKGNNNVYCQDNETSWLDWRKLEREKDLFEYVKGLIAIRRKHPVLHCAERLLGMDQIACGMPDVSYHGESAWQVPSEVSSRQLGIMYCGTGVGDNDCFAIYNMHWVKHTFALPTLKKKKWYLVVSTEEGVLEIPKKVENQKSLEMKERTVALLIGR
ncbi:MAG: alpha-amylase family glycosyl hydrolase [Hespellia sp.]|nr:alpha-amylase family glycosyl hydrolase [Hespellia sp.]